jgi:hypothetical protein
MELTGEAQNLVYNKIVNFLSPGPIAILDAGTQEMNEDIDIGGTTCSIHFIIYDRNWFVLDLNFYDENGLEICFAGDIEFMSEISNRLIELYRCD